MRNPLNNNDVNGNSLAWLREQDEGEQPPERYMCDCSDMVDEKDWNKELKCCKACAEDDFHAKYMGLNNKGDQNGVKS